VGSCSITGAVRGVGEVREPRRVGLSGVALPLLCDDRGGVGAGAGAARVLVLLFWALGSKLVVLLDRRRSAPAPTFGAALFPLLGGFGRKGLFALFTPLATSVFGRKLQCQPVRGSGHPRGMALVTRM
jgi:hypothetical protein